MKGDGNPRDLRPGRRVRIDRMAESLAMPIPMHGPAPSASGKGIGSGRVFVTSAVLAVLVLWVSLYLVFRQWRYRYRERAAFGARYVASAIDPLALVVPAAELPGAVCAAGCAGASALTSAVISSDTNLAAWYQAIEETHAMLVTVTAANVLDRPQMRELQGQIAARVARARPETARAVLAEVWNDLEDKAGPIVRGRHPRPALLPPR
jgi:hypothetical protein